MKSLGRSWALVALAVFAAASSSQVDADLMTYNVTSPTGSSPTGWNVTGTITTPGTGTYSSASQWSYNIAVSDGSTTYEFSEVDSGAYVIGSEIIATGSALSLTTGSLLFAQNATNYLEWAGFPGESYWKFDRYSGAGDTHVVFSPTPQSGSVIGTAAASSVPEIDPATGGSALSLVAGVLAMIEQRRRRRGLSTALTA